LSIDPDKLERDPFNGCKPVYPWNFVRTNTIYGVIHAAGGFTAWSDKHPVYAVVSGPTGTNSPTNVDDYYAPEVNSNVVNIPNFKTVNGTDCSTISNNTSGDWTTDFDSIKCYDQLKVNAVVNWINGKNHLGTSKQTVPAIFGMNFQAVSVGQKLSENGVKGGYTDPLAMTLSMLGEIKFVDDAIGQMVAALKHQVFSNQPPSSSPLNTANRPSIRTASSHSWCSGTNGIPPSAILAALLQHPQPLASVGWDDVSQLWLTNSSDTTKPWACSRPTPLLPESAKSSMAARSTPFLTHPACPTLPSLAAF
jgi:hypothetical protein